MSKPKLTPWFPRNKKPVNVGVYETDDDLGILTYQYWNGRWWGFGMCDVAAANKYKKEKSLWQKIKWRGFTEKQS